MWNNKRQMMWSLKRRTTTTERLLAIALIVSLCSLALLYQPNRIAPPPPRVETKVSENAGASIPISTQNVLRIPLRPVGREQLEMDGTHRGSGNIPSEVNRTVVLVLGMHHSMTSVATKMLVDSRLFYAGELEELLIRRDNPMKYWELRKAVHVDQVFFDHVRDQSSIGARSLFNWLGYGVSALSSSGPREILQERATHILKDLVGRTPAGKITVVKDPRMSLTANVWLEAAGRLEHVRPVCVVLIRDPMESVYRFLADYNTQRSVLSAKQWGSVWEQYTFMALRSCFAAGVEVHVVRHEDYAKNPALTTKTLISNVLRVPLSMVPDPDVPPKWEEKHRTKEALWISSKVHLPLLEKDLLSENGFRLWQYLQNPMDHLAQIRELAITSDPPKWLPLSYQRNRAYAVQMDEGTTKLTLKVLRRSIQTFDSSRTLVLKTASRAAEIVSEAIKDGWTVVPCDSADSCDQALNQYQERTELKGSQMIVGMTSDGTFRLDDCPQGACVSNQAVFDAFASIGGRVSEVEAKT